MVGHEAPTEDSEVVLLGVLMEQVEVAGAVLVGEEDMLAVVAPLGDVMRHSGDDQSRAAWHELVVLGRALSSQIIASDPFSIKGSDAVFDEGFSGVSLVREP
jgi:hypothetical protein